MYDDFNKPTYYEPPPPTIQRGGLYSADGLRDGLVIPLAQAIVTGIFCGLAALAVTAWFGLPWLAIGGTTAAVVMAGSWMAYRNRWQFVLEKIIGVDLNSDGYIGQPLPVQPMLPADPLRVIVQNPEGTHAEYIDLPYPEKLPQLAAGLLDGKVFSQTAWVAPELFTRAQFDQLRGEMIRRGLARWRNPNAPAQGAELTAKGKALCRGIVENTPTLPAGDR